MDQSQKNITRIRIICYAKYGPRCCLLMVEIWYYHNQTDVSEFVYSTVSLRSHDNIHFDPISFEGRVVKRCSTFAQITVSVVAYIVCIHQGLIKATTL